MPGLKRLHHLILNDCCTLTSTADFLLARAPGLANKGKKQGGEWLGCQLASSHQKPKLHVIYNQLALCQLLCLDVYLALHLFSISFCLSECLQL